MVQCACDMCKLTSTVDLSGWRGSRYVGQEWSRGMMPVPGSSEGH